MSESEIAAVEKALLLVTLGFLEAYRCDAIGEDEVFYTVGIPKLIRRMETVGISPAVADLVSQLDEFGSLKGLVGEQTWRASIETVMEQCKTILRTMPYDLERPEPILKLLS